MKHAVDTLNLSEATDAIVEYSHKGGGNYVLQFSLPDRHVALRISRSAALILMDRLIEVARKVRDR